MSFTADDIVSLATKVTKEWTKQIKAEERGRRSRSDRAYVYSDRVHFTEVMDQILPPAYKHASGNGRYTVAKRQLYYACREEFRRKTGRPLKYPYFSQTLLVQYVNRHPEAQGWKLTADPRGTLIIPNAGHAVEIPVGTIQIDQHLRKAGRRRGPFDDLEDCGIDIEWPSLAAGQRYRAVVYIEKEGFGPLLKEARIAERFDVALISCKGQSVVAARRYVDQVCAAGGGVPLGVIRDLDKHGFEICQRLTTVSDWAEENDRVKYRFKNEIDVTDLGLRLADARKYGLIDRAERWRFRGSIAPDSTATPAEREFLASGRRIELNAFTSPEFIAWLEEVLTKWLGKERFIPKDDILADAHRRALAVARINKAIEEARDGAIEEAEGATLPATLRKKVKRRMKQRPEEAWDKALYEIIREELENEDHA
jgi:hypothetical protein